MRLLLSAMEAPSICLLLFRASPLKLTLTLLGGTGGGRGLLMSSATEAELKLD